MLEVNNINFQFPNSNFCLDNIDFNLNCGEILSIVGPSGSGKSTLFNLISGILKPDHGLIKFSNQTLCGPNEYSPIVKRDISLVFQEPILFPHLTVNQNLDLCFSHQSQAKIKEKNELIEDYMDLISLRHKLECYPHQLSGGEQQRISIIRALLLDQPLILLDEPFGHLDQVIRPSLRLKIRNLLKKHHKTAIFITHDTQEALEISDKILVLKNGRIEQYSTPREICLKPKSKTVANLFKTGVLLKKKNIDTNMILENYLRKFINLNQINDHDCLFFPYSRLNLNYESGIDIKLTNKIISNHFFLYSLSIDDKIGTDFFPSCIDLDMEKQVKIELLRHDIHLI